MAWFFLNFLLHLFHVHSACFRWECAPLPNNLCYQRDDSHLLIQIRACDQGQKCSIDEMSSVMAYDFDKKAFQCVDSSWLPTKKFPGEVCGSESECISNMCIRSRCKGLEIGVSCLSYDYCDVGLICVQGVCVRQKPAGEACLSDDDCTNDSLCFNGICASLFSLPVNSQFQNVSINSAYLCDSGYLRDKKCLPAPSNSNPPDFPCYSPNDCQILFPDQRLSSGDCTCGFNMNGQSYCLAQPGDAEFLRFKANLRTVIPTANKCHFNISLSERCPELAALPMYEEFLNSYYVYYYRHGIIGLPECLKSIMPFSETYEYSNGESQKSGSGSSDKTVVIVVVVVVFTVIMSAGVVCCLCVRKCATDERNQEIIRQRFMQEDMEAVPVRTGNAVQQVEATGPPGFDAERIVLDRKNKRFLSAGIPLAIRVDPNTFEPVEEICEVGEWARETQLAAVVDNELAEMLRDNSREEEHPPGLPEKSRPGTSSTS